MVYIKLIHKKVDTVTVITVIAGMIWLYFQLFVSKEQQPPGLTQVFVGIIGGWITRQAREQEKKEEARDDRVGRIEQTVGESPEGQEYDHESRIGRLEHPHRPKHERFEFDKELSEGSSDE